MLGLFTFMQPWNDFFWPFIVADPDNPTVQVALSHAVQRLLHRLVAGHGGHPVATLPLLVVFVLFGRQLVGGIMEGRSRDDHAGRPISDPCAQRLPGRLRLGRGHRGVPDRGRGRRGRPRPLDLGHLLPHARARSSTATPATSPSTTTTATRDDVALMADLGPDAYRFSVVWPRVQPTGAGPANQAGLDFYRRLSTSCSSTASTPWVTLYHWDLPQALEDAGGWPDRDTAYRFADYAASCTTRSATGSALDHAQRAVVLGVPRLRVGRARAGPHRRRPPRCAAAHHLLLGHGLAVQAMRAADAGRAGRHHAQPVRGRGAARRPGGRRRGPAHRRPAEPAFLDPVLRGALPGRRARGPRAARPARATSQDGDLEVDRDPDRLARRQLLQPATSSRADRAPHGRLDRPGGSRSRGSAGTCVRRRRACR